MNDTLSIFLRTNQALYDAVYASPKDGFSAADTSGSFFIETAVDIVPVSIAENNTNLFILVILFLAAILALMKWYMPDRLLYEFDFGERLGFGRKKTNILMAPSLAIDFFFLLNYLFSISLLTYLFSIRFYSYTFPVIQGNTLFLQVLTVYFAYWVYRKIGISFLAFVFITDTIAQQQSMLDKGIRQLSGILVLPLLLLAMLSNEQIFLPAALITVVGLQVFRWIQTISIGIRSTRFSAFHFILYLCALEIVPVIVILKLLFSGSYV